jgi:hypothetical protein
LFGNAFGFSFSLLRSVVAGTRLLVVASAAKQSSDVYSLGWIASLRFREGRNDEKSYEESAWLGTSNQKN